MFFQIGFKKLFKKLYAKVFIITHQRSFESLKYCFKNSFHSESIIVVFSAFPPKGLRGGITTFGR